MSTPKIRADQRYSLEAQTDLDLAVDLIDGIRLKAAPKVFGGAPVPPFRFNNALLFSTTLSEVWKSDDIWIGPEIFELGPVHGRCVTLECEDERDIAALSAVDSVTVRETKGLVSRPMPRMLRVSKAHIRREGYGTTEQTFYGLNPDGTLVNITNMDSKRYRPLASKTLEHQFLASVTAGFQMYLRYCWTVKLRSVGSNFGLTIPTTPEGARALLALRDVESGMSRRRALRHWVVEHNRRRTAEDAERDVKVRAHLRGVTTFKWDDLEGTIRPSDYDLERTA